MANPLRTPTPPVEDRRMLQRRYETLNWVDACVALIDERGTLLFQNKSFARLNDATRDSAHHFGSVPTLFDCPSIQELVRAALDGRREVQHPLTLYYSPKIKVDLNLRVRPIKTNRAGDVTLATLTFGEESLEFGDRHVARAQETLQQLGERIRVLSADMIHKDRLIRTLLKEAPFAFILMNEQRQVIQVNRAAERLFGRRERELMGQSCEAVVRCYQACQRCPILDDHVKIDSDEVVGVTQDHRPIPLLRSAVVFDDADNKIIIEAFIDLTERKQAEDKLARLGRILDDSPNEIYVFDAETLEFMQVNHGGQRNLGYSLDELKRLTVLDLMPEFDREGFLTLLSPLRDRVTHSLRYETRHRRRDGSFYPIEARLQYSSDENPPVFCAIVQDISERREAEAQMRTLSSAVEQTADIVVITDRHGIIQYVNPAYEAATGYAYSEVLGRNASVVKSDQHDARFYQELWHTILDGRVFRGIFINRRKDGSLYYEEKTITPLKDSAGQVVRFVSTGNDITERLLSEERMEYLAHHDPLTDLPNRVLLQKRLNQAMHEADKLERMVAVIYIDLDHFKTINDTLGHAIGDALLKAVAERLTGTLRPGDVVSRLGGDEFTIVLANISHVDDVTHVSQKILDQFLAPFRVAGRELFISPSIGITLYPLDEKDGANLLRDADIAMYRAKELGRNQFQFYTSELNARAARRLDLETGLRQALERQEFVLHYQPLVDMKSGRIQGMEALLRWQHPHYGLIPPLDFIPLAEETGLIVPIGEWVIKTACQQVQAWRDSGYPGLQVAINLSSKQLRDKNLVKVVEQALAKSGVEANALDLELTESVLMQDMDLAAGILNELNAIGVSFSLDDFGTGYSSLSYLKRFPIDYLKIDRSFIRDITTDPVGAGIVQAIIAMAKVLKIKVIAEGVETEHQLRFLREHGCDIIQGYFCSRPIDEGTFRELLQDWDRVWSHKCDTL